MCPPGPELTPQELPRLLRNGVRLTARRWPWQLRRSRPGASTIALDVTALARGAPTLATLLAPFDRVTLRRRPPRWRELSPDVFRRAVGRLAGAWPGQGLACLSALRTAPWPHQLEPALALVEGRGARLLVADAVGLGKTMSAAVVLAELAARGVGVRVLALVPAGLRDQWHEELASHVGLDADVVDWSALARRSRQTFAGESPWSVPGCAIVSLDFAKQPSVLAGLAEVPWDLLIVDEAHAASGDSARAAAVARLGARSRVVLLLTATPHGGDRRQFRALTSVGAAGAGALVWFRHDRDAAGLGAARRTRSWRLRPTRAERTLDHALRAYAARVERTGAPESRLAMIVLKKRALSSAEALGRSLEHRRRLLGEAAGAQLLLPLEGPPGEVDTSDGEQPALLGSPGLDDRPGELAELDRLSALAALAARGPAKWRAIDRLLGATAETAILFTEYRDTLAALVAHLGPRTRVAVLHGGLGREDRAVEMRRFTGGDARVLVATDAAAEGLNLQARCRLVVNVELPWSPTRLEQRVGRVDRLGQRRTVHEWRLAGASGHEATVVAALARRASAIREDLAGVVQTTDLRGENGDDRAASAPQEAGMLAPADLGDLARRAAAASALLARLRRLAAGGGNTALEGAGWSSPGHLRLRPGAGPGRGVILIFTCAPRAAGDAEQHVAVHVALSRFPSGSPGRWLPWLADAAAGTARAALDHPSALVDVLASRERAVSHEIARAGGRPTRRWQASLFDRRAERAIEAAHADRTRALESCHERIAQLETSREAPLWLEPVFALLVP
jgi:superfamily II DNA or RNA helicase